MQESGLSSNGAHDLLADFVELGLRDVHGKRPLGAPESLQPFVAQELSDL